MPGRSLLFVSVLVLSVAVPFIISDEGKKSLSSLAKGGGKSFFADWVKEKPADQNDGTKVAPVSTTTRPILKSPTADIAPVEIKYYGGPVGMTLLEALYFDATPAWVAQNWPRVTTRLPASEYHGVRVPLVTGNELDDVAGSLSFYFDANSRVQRITLTGYTGDYESIVFLAQQRFGLRQYSSVGTALYLAFWEGRPIGCLRVDEGQLQSSDSPQTRYRIEMELNLPRPGATLSDAALQRLQKLREARLL